MRKGENIYKRKDGRWEAKYKNGYKTDGTTKYSSVYGKTYGEAKEKREKVLKELQTPKPKKNKIILNELFKMYINHIKFNVKYSTLAHYDELYNNQIAPTLGGLKIVCINSDVINSFIDTKLDTLSDSYTNDIVVLLLAILEHGRALELINTKFNIKKIKIKSKEVEVFNSDERERLESHIVSNINFVGIGILLSRFTGLRIGEICALKLFDIDLIEGIIKVNKTMQRVKNLDEKASAKTKIIIDTPKSDKSIRDVPLPKFLIKLIKELTTDINNNAYLLTGSINKFIEPRTLEYKYKQVLKACKVDYKKFHTLRHTFATLCVVNGYYDIKTLSEVLGHSSVKITLDKYVHSNITLKMNGVKKIDDDFLNSHLFSQKQLKMAQ